MLIVEIDRAATAEHDDLLGTFGSLKIDSPDTTQWWQEHVMDRKQTDLSKLEGYREMRRKFVAALTPEERLEGLAPEQRLAGLAPEQRLAGLAPEEILVAAPIEILRALSEEALDALSPEARAIVRRRLDESSA